MWVQFLDVGVLVIYCGEVRVLGKSRESVQPLTGVGVYDSNHKKS